MGRDPVPNQPRGVSLIVRDAVAGRQHSEKHSHSPVLYLTKYGNKGKPNMSLFPLTVLPKSPTQTEDSQFWFSQFMKCNFFNLVVATPDIMVDTPLWSSVACHNIKATNS